MFPLAVECVARLSMSTVSGFEFTLHVAFGTKNYCWCSCRPTKANATAQSSYCDGIEYFSHFLVACCYRPYLLVHLVPRFGHVFRVLF